MLILELIYAIWYISYIKKTQYILVSFFNKEIHAHLTIKLLIRPLMFLEVPIKLNVPYKTVKTLWYHTGSNKYKWLIKFNIWWQNSINKHRPIINFSKFVHVETESDFCIIITWRLASYLYTVQWRTYTFN